MDFLSHILMNGNQIRDVRVDNVAGNPSTPQGVGQVIYDTTGNVLKYWNGTAWLDTLSRANHTGTQLAATISNFDTAVRASRLDQMAVPTAALNLNAQRITALAEPSAATDAVTKQYVDQVAVGLMDVKQSVRVATTANITLSGLQTIDGVTVIAGDRVLVKNQTTGSQNGIYVASAGAWNRATDADASTEVTAGLFVFVVQGTANADTGWILTTDDAIVLGTTALTFAQFTGTGQITPGDGLAKNGATLSIAANAGQFQFVGGLLSLTSLFSTRKYTASIGDGTNTSYVVTHNLNTRNIVASVVQAASPYGVVMCDIEMTTALATTFRFAVPPTSNQYNVTLLG